MPTVKELKSLLEAVHRLTRLRAMLDGLQSRKDHSHSKNMFRIRVLNNLSDTQMETVDKDLGNILLNEINELQTFLADNEVSLDEEPIYEIEKQFLALIQNTKVSCGEAVSSPYPEYQGQLRRSTDPK